jgi:hypothetical protein
MVIGVFKLHNNVSIIETEAGVEEMAIIYSWAINLLSDESFTCLPFIE